MTFNVKDIAPFQNLIKDLIKESKGEFDDWFGIGLSDYINDRYNKFSHTNTFLFRNTKVPFYNVYFSLTLSNDEKSFNSDDIYKSIFSISNCISIIGIAGSGKSMLMKHTFLQACESGDTIPIFIELRDLNNLGITLTEFIYLNALKGRIKGSTRILERSFSNGNFIFFLDGFDEVAFDIKDKIVNEIDLFVDEFPNNKFILSSRPGTNIESIPRFNSFEVLPLETNQIFEFIDKQMAVFEDDELKSKLITTCSTPENTDYIEYLSNPLLLSMFILTFRSYPELPKSKNKFYWNVFDTLCTKHDSINKKGGYIHDKKTKLADEEFENILKWFSYVSILEDEYNFEEQYLYEKFKYLKQVQEYNFEIKDLIYDLSVSISILISEGLQYKFPHRTLQDYFMARFIKDQSEEHKKDIYMGQFKRVVTPYRGNKNIFDLCVELDKINFYKYYLIPIFEEFKEFIDSKSIIDLGIELYKKLGLGYRFYHGDIALPDEKFKKDGDSVLFIYYKDTFLPYDISTYFKIEDIFKYKIYCNSDDDFINKMREFTNKKKYDEKKPWEFNFRSLPNELVKEFILHYSDLNAIENFKNQMITTESLLKDELGKNLQVNNALKDFPTTKNLNYNNSY